MGIHDPKGGRPEKLDEEQKYQVYAYYISGMPLWEIMKRYEVTDKTIMSAFRWVRRKIPKFNDEMNLMDAIRACRDRIFELNIRKGYLIKGYDETFEKTRVEAGGKEAKGKRGGKGSGKTTTERGTTKRQNWNAYIGVMRELRENHQMLHELQGLLKTVLALDKESFAGLWDIMNKGKGEGE